MNMNTSHVQFLNALSISINSNRRKIKWNAVENQFMFLSFSLSLSHSHTLPLAIKLFSNANEWKWGRALAINKQKQNRNGQNENVVFEPMKYELYGLIFDVAVIIIFFFRSLPSDALATKEIISCNNKFDYMRIDGCSLIQQLNLNWQRIWLDEKRWLWLICTPDDEGVDDDGGYDFCVVVFIARLVEQSTIDGSGSIFIPQFPQFFHTSNIYCKILLWK